MRSDALVQKRFNELDQASISVKIIKDDLSRYVDIEDWQKWSTSVLNLLNSAFGSQSVHYQNFKKIHDNCVGHAFDFEAARGVFLAAKEDYEGGYAFSLEASVSGEVFGDFVLLAKRSLVEGYKDVAAVLACAALEDALKRYARLQGIDVDNEVMQAVVNRLKSKGLVGGAQKTLLDSMPKIRDYSMHANWDKIRPEDVNSVIGFVERFLLERF